MAGLYVDRRGGQLSVETGQVVIRVGNQAPQRIPLKLLDRVIIQAQTALDSTSLGRLADAGVDMVILSGRHGQSLAQVRGQAHADARRRLAQYAAAQDLDARVSFAQGLITAKLQAQRRFLCAAEAERADARYALRKGMDALGPLIEQVAAAEELGQITGIEGAGAAAYFRALVALFPPELGFHGRNRRPPRDPVNALLSLTYTVVHSEAVTACHRAGLEPLVGLFHGLAYGRESLASDLIEPLRPRVDAWVWDLLRGRLLRKDHFRITPQGVFLGKRGRVVYFEQLEEALPLWRRYLRQRAFAVVHWLTEQVHDERRDVWSDDPSI